MSLSVGTLSGYLELEDRLSPALRLAERNLATTGAKLDDLGGSLRSVGSDLLPLSAGLLAAGGASSVMAATFDASMTRLVTTAGVADDEIDGVREHILALAPAAGIGPLALADAMMKVSSTVDNTATALSILDIAAQGTKAGFGATIDVAGALTTVINSYGASNITAAHAGDVLAMAIKEGGAEAKELAPTLANVVPFAAQLGISFEEVAANLATLTKLGVPTTEAVTQLTSVFTALSKETKQGTDALASMGMSYAGIREEIREKGLAATLTDLAERFRGNETVMLDVFGRIEAVKNIMGTAGVQAGTYAEVLERVKGSSDNAGGALKKMADAMTGKTIQNWNELTATVGVLAIKVGDVLAPALGQMMAMAMPVLQWVSDAVAWFGKLPTPIQNVGLAIVGLMAIAGPALFALGTISSIAGVAVSGLGMLTGAIGLMSWPLRYLISQIEIFGFQVGVSTTSVYMFELATAKMAAVARSSWMSILGPIGLATAALALLYDVSQRFGSHVKNLTDDALAKEIEALKNVTGTMAGSRLASLEAEQATRDLARAAEEAANGATNAADANAIWGSGLGEIEAAEQRAAAAAKHLSEEQQKLLDQFSGADLLKNAKAYELVLTRIGGASKLTTSETEKFVGAFDDVIAKYKLLGPAGAAVVAHYSKLADSVRDFTKMHEENLKIQVENEARAWSERAAMLDFNGERALREAERQYDEWQAASVRNLRIDEELHRASAQRKAAMYDQAGLNELERIQAHYDRVGQYSKAALQQIADEAWRDYAEAARATGMFSEEAIKHFREIAEAAQRTADGVEHDFGTMGENLVKNLEDALLEVPGIIADAFSGDLKGEDLGKKIGGTIGGAIGGAIGGYFGGPFGAALGSSIGTEIGQGIAEGFRTSGEDVVRRIGNDWGTAITEEMGNAIANTAKNLFQGDRLAAEIYHIKEILLAAGGLTVDNADTFLGKLRDTFVMLATGMFTASEATEVLDDNFAAFAEHFAGHGQMVSEQFLEIIRLADAAGLHVEAINEYVTNQTTNAVGGLNTLITNSTVTTQAAATGLTAALGAAFEELTRRGMSAADAIKMLSPTIDALEAQLVAGGLSGGAAFDQIRAMSVMAADAVAGPLLTAIHGGAQAIVGLHNAGILTQEMFTGLSSQITSTFERLIAQGYSGSTALALVGADIQKIWEAQQDFGLEVDDSTQRLIDQALEAGLVGEAHRSAQDRAVQAMERAAVAMQHVGDVLERVFGDAGDDSQMFADRVHDAIDSIPTEVRVAVHFDVDDVPGTPAGDNGPSWSSPGNNFVGDNDFSSGGGNEPSSASSDMYGIADVIGEKIGELTSNLPNLMENAVRHGVQTAGRRI